MHGSRVVGGTGGIGGGGMVPGGNGLLKTKIGFAIRLWVTRGGMGGVSVWGLLTSQSSPATFRLKTASFFRTIYGLF